MANDLYIDRDALDASFPSQMTVFNGALFLPANYGTATYAVPSGGISTGTNGQGNNEAFLFGIDQALVIADVDTPPDGSVTVTLTVDKGLILLNPSADSISAGGGPDGGSGGSSSGSSSNSGSSAAITASPDVNATYKFLVAEAREVDTDFITNALLSRGHLIDTVRSGEDAFARIVSKFIGSHYLSADDARRYDAVMISLDFAPGSVAGDPSYDSLLKGSAAQLDGIQTIRLLRAWEAAMVEMAEPAADVVSRANAAAAEVALKHGLTYSSPLQVVFASLGVEALAQAQEIYQATYNDTSFGVYRYKPIKIISMSKRYRMQSGDTDAYAAGADLFLYEPEMDYPPLCKLDPLNPYSDPLGITHDPAGRCGKYMIPADTQIFGPVGSDPSRPGAAFTDGTPFSGETLHTTAALVGACSLTHNP